jgi:hypothetical protein
MFQLGRLPRKFYPFIPHYSALTMRREKTLLIPDSCDYTPGLPVDVGMMLNDAEGDCTCAGVYHARQVLTQWAAKNIITESDNCVQALYEQACGYDPNDPNTDKGGVEQDVLGYCVNTGFPIGDGTTAEKLLGFFETDPRNTQDVKECIYESGLVYIGFEVPRFLMYDAQGNPMTPPDVWDVPAGVDVTDTVGGHCVILPGYNVAGTYPVISWGRKYGMTQAFFDAFVDEVYSFISQDWTDTTGITPIGMTVADWEAQMAALKMAG